MKKKYIFMVGFLLIVLFVLTGCNSSENKQENANNANNIVEFKRTPDSNTSTNTNANTNSAPYSDAINNAHEAASNQVIQMFNESLLPYGGSNVSGQKVKSLISAINSSNTMNPEHTVECSLDGETNASISKIKTNLSYSVDFSYDSEGYINKVIIEELS